jgi:outer membrane biosynthesis protein TonB
MGRLSAPLIALLLAAAVAVGLSACGSSGGAELLPGATASEIKSNLDEVRQLVEAGECPAAADAATKVSLQVEELSGVDAKLKQALSEGAARLGEVVSECDEAPEESTEAFESEEEEPEIDENEKPAKTKKPKPEKEAEPAEETAEPPAQEEDKGKGKGPPEEAGDGAPSGGVGPGTAVEGE